MRSLDKKLVRDLLRLWGQILAIVHLSPLNRVHLEK
jgi:hypothetical protein